MSNGNRASTIEKVTQDKKELEVSDLVRELQELTSKKTDNFDKTASDITDIVGLLNELVNSLGNLVEEAKVIDSEKAYKYLLEEDVDKILLVNGYTTADLESLSVANKKKKAESYLAVGSEEYKLATTTKVANVKEKVIKAVKSELTKNLNAAIDTQIEGFEKSVEEVREKLTKKKDYQEKIEEIEQAKADKAIKEIRKKRAAKRKSVERAAAEAGIAATLDGCVDQTRENMNASFDNAVRLTKSTMEDKDPDIQKDVDEIREEVLDILKQEEYKLRVTQPSSDKTRAKSSSDKTSIPSPASQEGVSQSVGETV